MKILWNTDVNAPGCPGEIISQDGQSLLIQNDWDFPGVARAFGWEIYNVQPEVEEEWVDIMKMKKICDHDGTDGTVDCRDCGITAGEFISAAYDWLLDNDGAEAEDQGFFQE